MNKKIIPFLSWGTTIFSALCGLVAFAMIFVTAIVADTPPYSVLQSEYSGLQVALGCSTTVGYAIFNPSAGIILAFAFPLLGLCVAVMGKGYKIVTAIAAALFVTGGALAFSAVSLLNPAIPFPEVSLGAGAIASGVLSLVGALGLCASVVIDVLTAKKAKK